MITVKYIESEYIESGATQGYESDFFDAEVDCGGDVVVLRKEDFFKIVASCNGIEFKKADA